MMLLNIHENSLNNEIVYPQGAYKLQDCKDFVLKMNLSIFLLKEKWDQIEFTSFDITSISIFI